MHKCPQGINIKFTSNTCGVSLFIIWGIQTCWVGFTALSNFVTLCLVYLIWVEKWVTNGHKFESRLNCRILCHSIACYWLRKASTVLCLVLQSLPTHVITHINIKFTSNTCGASLFIIWGIQTCWVGFTALSNFVTLCLVYLIWVEKWVTNGHKFESRLNCRILCHSIACYWLRKASTVLCLVLQSLPTHVNEVDQSDRVFCLCSKQWFSFGGKRKT